MKSKPNGRICAFRFHVVFVDTYRKLFSFTFFWILPTLSNRRLFHAFFWLSSKFQRIFSVEFAISIDLKGIIVDNSPNQPTGCWFILSWALRSNPAIFSLFLINWTSILCEMSNSNLWFASVLVSVYKSFKNDCEIWISFFSFACLQMLCCIPLLALRSGSRLGHQKDHDTFPLTIALIELIHSLSAHIPIYFSCLYHCDLQTLLFRRPVIWMDPHCAFLCWNSPKISNKTIA